MDLSGVITSFTTGTYPVARPAGSFDANGVFSSTSSSFDIDACVLPLKGNELMRLPEGMRGKESRWVLTPTAALRIKDSITISGSTWQVELVEDWSDHGNYWRALAQRDGN